jgi:hypothetical protein
MSENEIRVFRFEAIFDSRLDVTGWPLPVPIVGEDSRLVGFASLKRDSILGLVASCAMDPSNPERLDLENGKPHWLFAENGRFRLVSKLPEEGLLFLLHSVEPVRSRP